jgi:polyhydroxyalkanoate synthase subunit PhaC
MAAVHFHLADEARRGQGLVLERLGFGPQARPARTVATFPAGRLIAYQGARAAAATVLIVPAPIKTAYIWDLAPGVSALQRFLDGGLQVYLLEWKRPAPGDEVLGLAQYAEETILPSVEAIRAETGERRVFLAGHSLGGTFNAIFASLHARLARGLLALEAPIAFGAGALDAAVARAPHASVVGATFGNVPGSFIDVASGCADPRAFNAEPMLDWLQSLPSAAARALHLRVRRWSLDEMPMPRQLFEDVAELLYRENRFVRRELRFAGRLADPRALDMPILAVLDPRSSTVPAPSMHAYRWATGNRDVEFLDYLGDRGVMLQHVGVLVGPGAHQSLWPRIVAWMTGKPRD